jgi:hypothetical protein
VYVGPIWDADAAETVGGAARAMARDGAFPSLELPPDAGPKGELILGPHHALDRPAV